MNGTDLLAEFRETGSERAFSELVRAYTNLVYSVAKRRLSNVALAQEASQTVFIRLAKAVPKIRSDAALIAWLHRTTTHVSIDLWRAEIRRHAREQHAVAMQPEPECTENPTWTEIAPILDQAVDKLDDSERQVILLRFFDQQTMRDLGARLGISEDAAKMRVRRALEKLRSRLAARGATCTAAVLAGLLGDRSVEAAPAEVALALAAIPFPVVVTGGIAGLAGVLGNAAKVKLVTGLAGAGVITGVALLVVHALQTERGNSSPGVARSSASKQLANQATGSLATAATGTNQNLPDPRKLLRGVATARQRILSGEVQLTMVSYSSEGFRRGTNLVRLSVLFDDNRFRYESFEREYSYTSMEPNASQITDARMRTENLDRPAAEKAGLLKGFDSHHVTTLDDLVSMDYWEASDQNPRADIYEAGKGWGHKLDPRSLGLTSVMSAKVSPESCLGFAHVKSIEIVGKEIIDDVPCWDIRSQFEHGSGHVWIDVEHPTRVIKHVSDSYTVLSKYDESDPKNPIPREVHITDTPNGSLRWAETITCISARYNIPVPAATWTLAGLQMKPSTPVVDTRIHRRIGYWTGTGLSEDWPPRAADPNQSTNREEMLALLNVDPASDAGFDAAHWLIMNSPDGPDVDKAADVILGYHIQSTNVLLLAHELDRMRPNSSRRLLQGMMDRNSDADVRGNACFTLATLVKDFSEYGSNKVATAEAIKLFERAMSEFGRVKRNDGYTLAELAKTQLDELRHAIIGQPVPETVGEDLDSQPLKLSDYRGKVVVVVFWGHCCRPDIPSLRDTQQRLAGKPFAIVGVYSDDHSDLAKDDAEEIGFTWPSFKEERGGPIATAWHSRFWPDTWILDEKGVIRRRGMRENSILAPVETLLAKPQQAAR